MNTIVIEAIESYNEYLSKVANGCNIIAAYLREDNIQLALKSILQFSEGMTWLTEISELLKKNDIQVELNIEQIHGFLHEINNGLEMQDYILVADMFEYEIAPFFDQVSPIQGINN